MKYSLPLTALFLLLTTVSLFPARARHIGLIDQTNPGINIGGFYDYSRGDYTPTEASGDTELISQLAGIRLDWAPSPSLIRKLQISFLAGSSRVEFGDSEPEDGTVYGGQIQYLLEDNDPYYLKLTASLLNHEEQDFDEGGSFEISSDWQAGFLLGRKTERTDSFGNSEKFNSYFGFIYKVREFELNDVGTVEYELDSFSGINAFAGISYTITDFLSLEGEARMGTTRGGSGRIIYHF